MSWKAERLLEDNNSVPKSPLKTIFISNILNIWYCRNTVTGFNKLRRRWEKKVQQRTRLFDVIHKSLIPWCSIAKTDSTRTKLVQLNSTKYMNYCDLNKV